MAIVKHHMDVSFAQRRNDILDSNHSVKFITEKYCFLSRHEQWIPEFCRIEDEADNCEKRWKEQEKRITSALKKELEPLGDLEKLNDYSGTFLHYYYM